MEKAEYDKMIDALLQGDNRLLAHLQDFQAYCQRSLMIKGRQQCDPDTAYDIFIEAVMAFRRNVMRGERPDYRYLRAYLNRICINMWLARQRSEQRKIKKEPRVKAALYDERTQPADRIEQAETAEMERFQKNKQLKIIADAMASLSEKCQQILQMAIVEEKPMREIAQKMGFANANVAKTTKSRCYNRLMKKIHG